MSLATLALLAASAIVVAQSAPAKGDRALGEYLASECVTCHQISGRITAGVPAIIGIDHDSFVALMDSYRKKERDNAVMQAIAAKFSDEELAALAAHFSSITKGP